jgi:heme-degrading monooxygenase HmoA
MIVTIFRSRLRPGIDEDYGVVAARMDALATSMPGYVSHKGFVAEDGERVTIVEFESDDALRTWRLHPEHREAEKAGRDRFYAEYSLTTTQVLRRSEFKASDQDKTVSNC